MKSGSIFLRGACALALASIGVLISSCTSTSLSGPTEAVTKCQVSLNAPSSAAAAGGTGSLAIGAAPECQWSATTATPWLSDLAPSNGQGATTLQFKVAPNPAASARQGDIVVNGVTAHVSQDPAPCSFDVAPKNTAVPADGGSTSLTVTTLSGCAWTAASQASWLTVTSGQNGSGSGQVVFTAAANPDTTNARSGTILIAGQSIPVTQPARSCQLTLSPTQQTAAAAGGTGTVAVTTTANCAWTPSPDVPWITIASVTGPSGTGSFTYNVAPNAGAARTGRIIVGSEVFTVAQTAATTPACSYALTPSNQSIAASGGAAAPIAVATAASCAWSAATTDSWLHLTGVTSGTGSGSVAVTVDANSGAARRGTITVAGQSVSIDQAAAASSTCSYQVAPTAHTIAVTGGSATTKVTTSSSCAWNAVSNDSWITIDRGATGKGDGDVDFTIAANPGSARSGTLTIAGTTVIVNQAALLCNYSITPGSENVPASSGTGTAISVTTSLPLLCSWNASTQDTWIHLGAPTSGNGNGTVSWTYDANTGSARSGAIAISGQSFVVSQAAAPAPSCSYSLSRTSQAVKKRGGAERVNVTATSGCAWTASSQASWITITSGPGGTGNGTVVYDVDNNNTGADRTGTLTIAGITFTVSQDH